MSIKWMSYVWKNGPVKTHLRLLLLALADNANDEGICWPSIKTLADKCGTGERNIQRHLRELESEEATYITSEHRPGRATLYRLVTPGVHATPGAQTTPGVQTTPTPGAQTTPPPAYTPPRTIKNLQQNHHIGATPVSKKQELTVNHPILQAWCDVMHRYPHKSKWEKIVAAAMGDVAMVTRVLQAWKSKGYNPTGYDDICDRFELVRAGNRDKILAHEKQIMEQSGNQFGEVLGL